MSELKRQELADVLPAPDPATARKILAILAPAAEAAEQEPGVGPSM